MNRLERVLRDAVARLAEMDRPCALLGGLAVSARAEPRFTRDVDLAVAVDSDPDAESLVRNLAGQGYRVLASVEQESAGRLATTRLIPPGESEDEIVLDLLFASSGIEPDIVHAAEAIEIFPGVTVRVARTGDLIALKILSRDDTTRPQDAADLAALLKVATEEDIRIARASAERIERRGYARGRSLVAAVDELVSLSRSRRR